jgi:hypothetical protein
VASFLCQKKCPSAGNHEGFLTDAGSWIEVFTGFPALATEKKVS